MIIPYDKLFDKTIVRESRYVLVIAIILDVLFIVRFRLRLFAIVRFVPSFFGLEVNVFTTHDGMGHVAMNITG